MNSMTGFGRGETRSEEMNISVELSGVNRKQSEISISLPRGLSELETKVRQTIAARISRGRVGVSVSVEKAGIAAADLLLDEDKVCAYNKVFLHLLEIAEKSGLVVPPPTLRDYMNIPDILSGNNAEWNTEAVDALLSQALETALEGFISMRRQEGEHIRQDLLSRLDNLEKTVDAMKELAPQVVVRFRENLHRRLNESGISLDLNDERLIKELGIFAERCDIAEEFTRLKSHFAQFRTKCASNEPAGRPLDFLCQEIFREFNTIGSKANDAQLAHHVVSAKTELEKIREQVQNIE